MPTKHATGSSGFIPHKFKGAVAAHANGICLFKYMSVTKQSVLRSCYVSVQILSRKQNPTMFAWPPAMERRVISSENIDLNKKGCEKYSALNMPNQIWLKCHKRCKKHTRKLPKLTGQNKRS